MKKRRGPESAKRRILENRKEDLKEKRERPEGTDERMWR